MPNETNQSGNATTGVPEQRPLDTFFMSAQEQQEHIQATYAAVKHVQKIFYDEQIIAPAQCTRMVNSIEEMSKPLQKLSTLLETSVYTVQEVSPFRHSLLIQVRSTNKRLQKLVELITDFSFAYFKPATQTNTQKHKILQELILFEEDSEEVLKCIDFLRHRVLLEEKRRMKKQQDSLELETQ